MLRAGAFERLAGKPAPRKPIRAGAHVADIAVVLTVTACCLAIELIRPAQRLDLIWLMFVPAIALLVGLVPAAIVRRAYRSAKLREIEQGEIVALLLKDYAAERGDWMWHTDVEGRLRDVGEKFASHAGEPSDRLEGRPWLDFLRARISDRGPVFAEIDVAVRQRRPFFNIETSVKSKAEDRWWRLAGKPIFRENRFAGYLGTISDITDEVQAKETMHRLAYKDGLTGLGNRSSFTRSLEQCVARLERYGTPFAVLYLDLDKFKAVNDGRGHAFGDKLLVEVGKRLMSTLRESDIIARVGGDEFALIVPREIERAEIATMANRLISLVMAPYEIDGETLVIGMSAGIALAPINGTRPDQIVRNADLALYRAKAEGGNRLCFFENRMDSDVRERRMLELEIADAIDQNEFVLYYQPLVTTREGRIAGFEALIRWNHPIRGLLSPAEFIPIAERSPLIGRIGEWTIREACRELKNLPEHMTVAVNLSTKHFDLADMATVVRSAIDASGISPNRLELEITESLLMSNPDKMAAKLRELKQIGVRIAMDDFGTGFSSLSYLLKFPFDKIKIDRSFVSASSEDRAAQEILKTIVNLAQTLEIAVTAEGVETLEQVRFLQSTECELLQGYHFARPMPADQIAHFIGASRTDVAA